MRPEAAIMLDALLCEATITTDRGTASNHESFHPLLPLFTHAHKAMTNNLKKTSTYCRHGPVN